MATADHTHVSGDEAHAAVHGGEHFMDLDGRYVTHGVSPKLVAAVVSAVASYLVTQEVLELPAWAVVVCQVAIVAVAVWMANPGNVELE